MDASHSHEIFQDNAPLSKRRRFVPDSALHFVPFGGEDNNHNQAFDSPLLLQLDGQMPTPEEIERELLQVGMRIRKSVNDGYKTIAFTPRPFFNMHRLSPATQAALCSNTLNRQPLSTATFCGINLAALAHISTTPVEEQKMWPYSTSHKRGYEGDSDSDDQEFMPDTPTLDADVNVMAMPAEYFNMNFDSLDSVVESSSGGQPAPHMSGRRIAQPRSKLQRPSGLRQQVESNPFAELQMTQSMGGTQWMGHKRVTSCGLEANMSLNDFGEASFLQRRDDVDMDCS